MDRDDPGAPLRKQVATLTRQVDYYHQQAILAQQLERQVGLDQNNSISSYRPVAANVGWGCDGQRVRCPAYG